MLFHRGNIFAVVTCIHFWRLERLCVYICILFLRLVNVNLGVTGGIQIFFVSKTIYDRGLCNATRWWTRANHHCLPIFIIRIVIILKSLLPNIFLPFVIISQQCTWKNSFVPSKIYRRNLEDEIIPKCHPVASFRVSTSPFSHSSREQMHNSFIRSLSSLNLYSMHRDTDSSKFNQRPTLSS